MANTYREIFHIRNQMQELKSNLNNLYVQRKTKGSREVYKKIDDTLGELENLEIRMFILNKLSHSCV